MFQLMKENAPEWWIICLGLLGTMVFGGGYPALSVLYGEVLKVYASPSDEILEGLHAIASLFIVMGVVVGIASFVQVRPSDHTSLLVLYTGIVAFETVFPLSVPSHTTNSQAVCL